MAEEGEFGEEGRGVVAGIGDGEGEVTEDEVVFVLVLGGAGEGEEVFAEEDVDFGQCLAQGTVGEEAGGGFAIPAVEFEAAPTEGFVDKPAVAEVKLLCDGVVEVGVADTGVAVDAFVEGSQAVGAEEFGGGGVAVGDAVEEVDVGEGGEEGVGGCAGYILADGFQPLLGFTEEAGALAAVGPAEEDEEEMGAGTDGVAVGEIDGGECQC